MSAAALESPMRCWTTDAVAAGQRLDYWVGAICEAFLEMDCSSRQAAAFEGRLARLAGTELAYNQVIAATQDVYRTPAAVARGNSHPFYLIAQLHTPWHVRQGGQLAQLRPGDAVLVDSAQCYELHFPQSVACLSIQLPRAWVGRWLAEVECSNARVVARAQGWGRVLSSLCLQLGEAPGLAAAYPQGLLEEHVGALLAASLNPAVAPAAASAGLVERAESLMRQQLDQPGLLTANVAAALGVSVRSLHRAFAAQGRTFMGSLRQLRLARAAELLSQRRLAQVSVAELGRRCGYGDASHFVREFQKARGLPPARWRRQRLG